MQVATDVVRARVLRRGVALLVDLFLAQVALLVIAAGLFPISGGRVIDTNSVYTACEAAVREPTGLNLPSGFQPTGRKICVKGLFGLTTARLLVFEHREGPTSATTTTVSYPVAQDNEPMGTFDIASLQPLALVLMRWFLDLYAGGSAGRRLVRIRLVRFAGVGHERGGPALTARYAVFGLALIPGLAALLALGVHGLVAGPPGPESQTVAGIVATAPLVVACLAAVAAIMRGRDAFYDEHFGTAVAKMSGGEVEAADGPAPAGLGAGEIQAVLVRLRGNLVASWPRLSVALVLLLVAVFAAEVLDPAAPGANAISPHTLVRFGAADEELVVQVGQWYRLLFSTFLHASAPHLIVNAVVILVAGWLLEGVVSRAWLLAIFLIGGLTGSLASVAVNDPAMLTVGASGGLLAMLSAGLVICFRVPDAGRRRWIQAFCLGIGLPTLLSKGQVLAARIDVADHVGGALGGAAVGLVMLLAWRGSSPHPRLGGAAAGIALSLCAIPLASITWAGFGDPPMSALLIPPAELPKSDKEWEDRSGDLVRRYPTDPRPHLARALIEEARGNAAKRDEEMDIAIKASRRVDPDHAGAFESNALLAVGTAAVKRHDHDVAMDLLDRAVLADPRNVGALEGRADLETEDQLFADALRDLQAMAALRPGDGRVRRLLAAGLFARGDIDRAIEELDAAAGIDPGDALAIRQRGWAEFYGGRREAALRDLEAAIRRRPNDAYAALWLDIASMRSGGEDRMTALSKDLDPQVWPAPIVKFFLGQIDEDALKVAASDPDPEKQDGQRCEVDFYVGEWHMMRHDEHAAGPYLSQALLACPRSFDEWPAVRAELDRAAGSDPDALRSGAP